MCFVVVLANMPILRKMSLKKRRRINKIHDDEGDDDEQKTRNFWFVCLCVSAF